MEVTSTEIQNNCGCNRCIEELCVERVPIFSGLDKTELQRVAGLITHKQYQKGELVLMAGQCNESLIIINQGKAKAFRYTREGREQVLYIFSVGDFFGETNLIRDQETNYNIEAIEDTGLCLIRKKDLHHLIHNYPEIGLKIMAELCNRLEAFENILQNMGTNSVELRINVILLEFARKFGREDSRGIIIDLPLSREGIANYIGLTRETVSRKLNLLQEDGLIEMEGNKRIIILDKRALEQSIE